MHSTISRWLTAASATALALALATAPAVAQACLGLGTLDGQGFAAGSAGFTDGAWGPGGAIGYDAVKHLVLCQIEGRTARLDLDIYPYLPRAQVEATRPASYKVLMSGAAA